MTKYKYLFLLFITGIFGGIAQDKLPIGFVYVKDSIPDIALEMRYCYENNFVGEAIDGYENDVCILGTKATQALKKVQASLRKKGYGLKIFDAYRPQRAVDHFVRWARDLNDVKMKSKFYPQEGKQHLFKRGYISSKSGHSRGSTVDITLIYLEGDKKGLEVDMGTPWDFFSKKSWPFSDQINEQQLKNRIILREAMLQFGFKPLRTEWWHFTLREEPFPNTYFDFVVK